MAAAKPIKHRRRRQHHAIGTASAEERHQFLRLVDDARQRGDRDMMTYWRLVLTVGAASDRARAGDCTAERRLAWRESVVKLDSQARWLHERFQAYGRELARLVR